MILDDDPPLSIRAPAMDPLGLAAAYASDRLKLGYSAQEVYESLLNRGLSPAEATGLLTTLQLDTAEDLQSKGQGRMLFGGVVFIGGATFVALLQSANEATGSYYRMPAVAAFVGLITFAVGITDWMNGRKIARWRPEADRGPAPPP